MLSDSDLAVGDRVWAWWNSPQSDYYVGTVLDVGGITRAPDGTPMVTRDYVVRFDDGDEMLVPPDLIRPLALPAELQIEFRPPDSPKYQPAVILAASTDAVQVRMPDSRELLTPLANIRIERRFLPPRT